MAAAATSGVLIKTLPGLEDLIFFSVHPNGSAAFFFDIVSGSHIKVNLATSQVFSIDTKQPTSVEGGHSLCDLINVVHGQRYFTCALIIEDSTNMLFVLTYYFKKRRTSIIDEHYLYINGTCNSTEEIIQGAGGEIFCVSSYRNRQQTFFSAAQIFIDENGSVQSNVIATNRSLNGHWSSPFVHSGSIYWLSLNSKSYFQRLLRVSLKHDHNERWHKGEKIDIKKQFDHLQGSTNLTQAVKLDDFVFYFVYVEYSNQYLLFYIDLKERCAKKFAFDMGDCYIDRNICMKSNSNGILYLHGNCGTSLCGGETHFYIINMNAIIKKQSSQETVAVVQRHTVDEKRIECGICFEQYDAAEKYPRVLPCGHTFCTTCVEVLIKAQKSKIICPSCRYTHTVNSITTVPRNFELINALDKLAIQTPSTAIQQLSAPNAAKQY